MLPKPLHDAAAAFDSIPGIGPRAALRYASWLATQSKEMLHRFARTFDALADGVATCLLCGAWADASAGELCDICRDPRRDESRLCVVATSQDIRTIEASSAFHGRYHVLGGLIDPIEGRTPETLNVVSLLKRLSEPNNAMTEIILALDPDMAGDTTASYLTKKMEEIQANSPHPYLLTRLARGIQHGAQIEYADGTTIADALQNRKSL